MTRRKIIQRAICVPLAVAVTFCATVADLALRSRYLIRTDQILRQLIPFFSFPQQCAGVGQLSLSNLVFLMTPDLDKVRIGLMSNVSASSVLGEMTGIPALGRVAGKSTSGTCQVAWGLHLSDLKR